MDATGNLQLVEDGEDELFFEGPDTRAPAAAPPPPPAAKRKAKRAAADAAVPAPEPLPLPAVEAPAAERDAGDEALPSTPAAATLPRLVLVALLLAVVASLFSAIGLLVAARTVTAAGFAREAAERGTARAERLDAAIGEVEALARAQRDALAKAQSGAATPVTAGDLRRELDTLRQSLGHAEAPGTTALAGVVRQGQAELSGRIDDLEARIDAISARATREARR